MGETFPTSGYAETQLNAYHSFAPLLPEDHGANGAAVANGEDEPYTIKCICGFDDDAFDGYTVFCDRCNTWQHIACYYSPDTALAEDFEHTCVDCNPAQENSLNRDAAVARQQSLRQPQGLSDDRRIKRPGPKSHKKNKARDFSHATNGWGSHEPTLPDYQHAFNPHEQGPPPKKAKTNHRASVSVASVAGPLSRFPSGSGRNRSGLALPPPVDTPRPPLSECPPDYFSADFIRAHHQNTSYRPAPTNIHNNVGVANLLSAWLDDHDAFTDVTNGKTHNDVLLRLDCPVEDCEPPIVKRVEEDTTAQFHGEYPRWPYLILGKDLAEKDMVGEIRGVIGLQDDYMSDPENQWPRLRHPDHFVFFHPILPIYIDSRSEGTLLRYARRSCTPNMEMKTVITGAREIRFCFMTIRGIPQGSELTINWDTKLDRHMVSSLSRGYDSMTPEELDYACNWVGTVLAHFGGCACQQPPNSRCVMSKWDRRLANTAFDPLLASSKFGRKRRPTKSSPPKTSQAVNSRATSDGPPYGGTDGDIEMEDSRSVSNSTTNKSNKTSRDGTPSDAHRDESAVRDNVNSERERRKVMQSEKLFEQMDKDTQQKEQKKKKRTSGSAANTPTIPTSKQYSRVNTSASYPNTPLPLSKSRSDHAGPFSQPSSARRTPVGPSSPDECLMPARPVYTEVATQTEETEQVPRITRVASRRPIPVSRCLFRRSLAWWGQDPQGGDLSKAEHGAVSLTTATSDEHSTRLSRPPTRPESRMSATLGDPPSPVGPSRSGSSAMDVDDPEPESPAAQSQSSLRPSADEPSDPTNTPSQLQPTHPPIKPPPPPWNTATSPEITSSRAEATDIRSTGLYVTLPSPPAFKSESPVGSFSYGPSAPVANMVQSPQSTAPVASMGPPLVSPSAQEVRGGITTASPAKKKLSLSEYTRRKTETPSLERTQSQGQPSISAPSSITEAPTVTSPVAQSTGAPQEGSSGEGEERTAKS